ncbi:MAG: H+/Cl- antiporter ClcA [Halobacteriales archaeon]
MPDPPEGKPTERTPTDRFLDALEVRRNATLGVVVGVVAATLVYAFFILIPTFVHSLPNPKQPPLAYLTLAFVFALGLALLVALALTLKAAIRLAREAENDP